MLLDGDDDDEELPLVLEETEVKVQQLVTAHSKAHGNNVRMENNEIHVSIVENEVHHCISILPPVFYSYLDRNYRLRLGELLQDLSWRRKQRQFARAM